MIAMRAGDAAAAAHRRRADHRARRDHPAADPRRWSRAARTRPAWPPIWVTHDLGVVARLVDRVVVMYAGTRRRGRAGATGCSRAPQHPYTPRLLAVAARPDRRRAPAARADPGPAAAAPPSRSTGCPFRPRCAHGRDGCTTRPALQPPPVGRAACWVPPQESAPGGAGASPNWGDVMLTGDRSRQAVPGAATATGWCTRWPGSRSELAEARRSASSASPAAASRRWPNCWSGWRTRPPGTIELDGVDLTALRGRALREQRRSIQMVFQDPYSSLTRG